MAATPDTAGQALLPGADAHTQLLARSGGTVELRGECPREIINVLDAVSMARDITRTALVNEILGEFTKKKLHESSLVLRLAGGNPSASEGAGA